MNDRGIEQALRMLSQSLMAGMTFRDFMSNPQTSLSIPEPLRTHLREVTLAGQSVVEGFRKANCLTPAELALLRAGERTGSLDSIFLVLAGLIKARRTRRRKLMKMLAYPGFLTGLAGVLLPLPYLVRGSLMGYLSIAIWLPLFVITAFYFGFVLLPKLPADSFFKTWPLKIGQSLPIVGKGLRQGAIAQFSEILGRCLGAGLPVEEALELAVKGSGSPKLHRWQQRMTRSIREGSTLTEALEATGMFSRAYLARASMTQHTGDFAKVFDALARDEMEAYQRSLFFFMIFSGGVILSVLVFVIFIMLVSGMKQYLNTITNIANPR